uniref:Small G protein signaling modulator 1 isoform X2 n=1 Tax=Rhizophora mucronata TaxID=61149 RepID=A0A2P2IM64_RHIMU
MQTHFLLYTHKHDNLTFPYYHHQTKKKEKIESNK